MAAFPLTLEWCLLDLGPSADIFLSNLFFFLPSSFNLFIPPKINSLIKQIKACLLTEHLC